MLKCFVSGCCGYIGSLLVPELAKHYEVIAVDSLLYGPQHITSLLNFNLLDNVKFYNAKLQDWENHKDWLDCDVYILLSAVVGESACNSNPARAYTSNYYSIKGFLEQIPQSKRVILPATTSGYGISNEDICTEDSKIEPLSIYGKSKYEAERLVADRDNSCILRLATVAGPSLRNRFDLLVNNMCADAYYNGQICLYECNYKRCFVYIKDVVRSLIWALSDSIQGTFNVASDNLTKMFLAELIQQQCECTIDLIEGEDKDKRNYFVSSSRIRTNGFEFRHSVNDGIRGILNLCDNFSYEQVMGMKNI